MLTRLLRITGVGVAVVVFVSWFLLALIHADDIYRLDGVSGVWLALADLGDEGLLYPPVFDGAHWGGTRYMPLSLVLMMSLEDLTRDLVLAAKLLTYLSTVVLVLVLTLELHRAAVRAAVTVLLVAGLLVSEVGLNVTLGFRGDVLPVALQLGAVAIVARSTSSRACMAAGVLGALAFLSKLNAVWGIAAVAVWLFVHARRKLAVFGATVGVTIVAGVLLVDRGTSGRFLDNLRETGSSGVELAWLAKLPTRFLELAHRGSPASLLIPVAVVAVVWAFSHRSVTIYHVAFLSALPVLAVTLFDVGAAHNHFADVLVLSVLVTGMFTVNGQLPLPQRQMIEVALVAVLAWSVAAEYQVDMREALQAALRPQRGGNVSGHDDERRRAAEAVADARSHLSDDPMIDALVGRRPIVLDSYMFRQLSRDHPDWPRQLAARIERQEFDRVVLDEPAGVWGFGPVPEAAVRRAYRIVRRVGGYTIYAPRRCPALGCGMAAP